MDNGPQMLQLRDFRPFKSSDEYLWAMKEDLSDWLINLYPDLTITPNTFMQSLETGITLCKHANAVRSSCIQWMECGKKLPKCWGREWSLPKGEVTFNSNAKPETFFARDNVHNFITWCRRLGIFECLLFESDDLILRKNEKNVILCLLEVARRGSHFGMAAPLLVQFEKEIDRDIALDGGLELSSSGEEEDSSVEYGPVPQIITNDLRSLDERVRELVERCTCPTQFPMIRVAEGKYRIGNTKVMIYVRILRSHVMVRVGGGWDTLAHYLDKHDPCRCSAGHRAAIGSRLIMKNDGANQRMKVEYERREQSLEPHQTTSLNPSFSSKKLDLSDSGSEISDEGYRTSDNGIRSLGELGQDGGKCIGSRKNSSNGINRSLSISTDEDRPDSRSTDEDLSLSPPKRKVAPVLKSHSTTRVPNIFILPTSKESLSAPRKPASIPAVQKHPPNASKTRAFNQPAHTRSYSASGTAEFFGARAQKLIKPGQRKEWGLGVVSTPKNTWNGYGSIGGGGGHRPKSRSNLFQSGLFRQNSDLGSNAAPISPNGDTNLPDLASCIKKALELNSDAEKISHIELVIKQYEMQQEDEGGSSIGGNLAAPNSLPHYHDQLLPPPPTPTTSSKRKEMGFTKIPKPKF